LKSDAALATRSVDVRQFIVELSGIDVAFVNEQQPQLAIRIVRRQPHRIVRDPVPVNCSIVGEIEHNSIAAITGVANFHLRN
jgi:hypothetical protein